MVGISAVKHNWSDHKEKRILIKISQDCKDLLYQKADNISTWNMIKGPRKIPIKDITGILYGGKSATFL